MWYSLIRPINQGLTNEMNRNIIDMINSQFRPQSTQDIIDNTLGVKRTKAPFLPGKAPVAVKPTWYQRLQNNKAKPITKYPQELTTLPYHKYQ